jgi:hypothetical protein
MASRGRRRLILTEEDLAARIRAKVDVRGSDECWPWIGGRNVQDYGQLNIPAWAKLGGPTSGRGRQKLKRAHRLVFEMVNGSIPTGLHVLHRCDNPPCCNPAHLFAGTAKDNALDAVAKGRAACIRRGELHPGAKLSHALIDDMRRLRRDGARTVDLATRYQLSQSAVSQAIRGKTWCSDGL